MFTEYDNAFLDRMHIAAYRPTDPAVMVPQRDPYVDGYRIACKWNARLLFVVVFLLLTTIILATAYYWETQHPRPRYSPEPRAAQPVMPYDKRSY